MLLREAVSQYVGSAWCHLKDVCTISGLAMVLVKESGTQQARVNFLYSDVAEVTGQ